MKYRIKRITYMNGNHFWVVEGKASFITGWAKVIEYDNFQEAENFVRGKTVFQETIIYLKD